MAKRRRALQVGLAAGLLAASVGIGVYSFGGDGGAEPVAAAFDHVAGGDLAALRAAIERDASGVVAATDVDGNTPLHRAVALGHPQVVSTLLEAGADPNAANAAGATPLLLVMGADGDQAQLAKLLLRHGADPTRARFDGLPLGEALAKYRKPNDPLLGVIRSHR